MGEHKTLPCRNWDLLQYGSSVTLTSDGVIGKWSLKALKDDLLQLLISGVGAETC